MSQPKRIRTEAEKKAIRDSFGYVDKNGKATDKNATKTINRKK